MRVGQHKIDKRQWDIKKEGIEEDEAKTPSKKRRSIKDDDGKKGQGRRQKETQAVCSWCLVGSIGF